MDEWWLSKGSWESTSWGSSRMHVKSEGPRSCRWGSRISRFLIDPSKPTSEAQSRPCLWETGEMGRVSVETAVWGEDSHPPDEFRLQVLGLSSLDKKRPSYGLHILPRSQTESTQMWFDSRGENRTRVRGGGLGREVIRRQIPAKKNSFLKNQRYSETGRRGDRPVIQALAAHLWHRHQRG